MLSAAAASPSSDAALIASWKHVSTQINWYFSLFLLVFGIVGNIFNILVLSQRSLRSNSCAWLFLLSSMFNLVSILSGLATRIIADWTYDITDTVGWLCKLRIFLLVTSRTIASWLIMLATLDRWLLSCVDALRRQRSTLKHAQRRSLSIITISMLVYSPILYCLDANLKDAPLKCYSKTIHCRIFVDQMYTCVTALLPLLLMFVFGFMTMSNVRALRKRLQSPLLYRFSSTTVGNEPRQRLKPIDRHLLIMLLVQISFLAIFTLPQALHQIYSTISRHTHKTPLRRTIENSAYTFAILLTYLASGMPFYIYTLSGGYVFRQTFFNLLTRMKQTVMCQQK